MFRFPFTNFHELNLDWILSVVKQFADLVPPMQTAVSDVQEALDDATEAVTRSEEALENANEAVATANEAKEIAEEAAQGTIADGSVTTAKLANSAVTSSKINDSAVISSKIDDGAITTAKLANSAVISSKINDGAITTDKITNASVTLAKLTAAIQNFINYGLLISSSIAIPSSGNTTTHPLTGLTANHTVIYWGFSSSPVNDSPCNLVVTTANGSFSITNNGGDTSESVVLLFAKPY